MVPKVYTAKYWYMRYYLCLSLQRSGKPGTQQLRIAQLVPAIAWMPRDTDVTYELYLRCAISLTAAPGRPGTHRVHVAKLRQFAGLVSRAKYPHAMLCHFVQRLYEQGRGECYCGALSLCAAPI